MKKYLVALILLLAYLSPKAQTMKDLNKEISDLKDRAALKELVDTFSILADQKETDKQRSLFAEDATSETFIGGRSAGKLVGRKQLGDAFGAFLANFETVYHINGQQTVTLNGDKASGISYCLVTLIGTENGKKMKTTFGVYYHDDFVRENGHWLIATRKATFAWQDKQPLGQ